MAMMIPKNRLISGTDLLDRQHSCTTPGQGSVRRRERCKRGEGENTGSSRVDPHRSISSRGEKVTQAMRDVSTPSTPHGLAWVANCRWRYTAARRIATPKGM